MASDYLSGLDDTIVAIGSPATPSPRGVIRFSGERCVEMASRFGFQLANTPSAHFCEANIDVGRPLGSVPIRALIWPTTRSYTGQPSLELHTIGSLPIMQAIIDRAIEYGARPARPGEFTLRAFLAGRLDLTQAEAVLGVIDAEDRGSLDHALRQLAGNLSRPMELLRARLLDLLADVEAGLDFVDEDIQFISDDDLSDRLKQILETVVTSRRQLSDRGGESIEWTVALRGLPNAGKSCLLNALCGHQAAIVTDRAGTTRDVVSVSMEIGGRRVLLVDTAGVENPILGSVDAEISKRAQQQATRAGNEADIRMWCVDGSAADRDAAITRLKSLAKQKRRSAVDLWVLTKCDRYESTPFDESWILTSAVSGQGMHDLRLQLINAIDSFDRGESQSLFSTAARCAGSLCAAEEALQAAIAHAESADGHEYVSSELRLAATALGEVTGAVYTDDVLDRVFSRFCIGK